MNKSDVPPYYEECEERIVCLDLQSDKEKVMSAISSLLDSESSMSELEFYLIYKGVEIRVRKKRTHYWKKVKGMAFFVFKNYLLFKAPYFRF